MRIDVQGDRWVGVSQLRLNVLDVLALLDEHTGIGVPEVMEPDTLDLRFFESRVEMPTEHIGMTYWPPNIVWEYKVKLRFGAVPMPLLEVRQGGRANVDGAPGACRFGPIPRSLVESPLNSDLAIEPINIGPF